MKHYGAKVAAIGLKRMLGRRSASVVDDPRVLSAPTQPYRVGSPYWKRGNGMLELPIQTTPGLRMPYIGTALTWGGPGFARWTTSQLKAQPLINLELHGIDVLDQNDGLQPLSAHQYDVRIPAHRKLSILTGVVQQLRGVGYAFERLDQVATTVGVR